MDYFEGNPRGPDSSYSGQADSTPSHSVFVSALAILLPTQNSGAVFADPSWGVHFFYDGVVGYCNGGEQPPVSDRGLMCCR